MSKTFKKDVGAIVYKDHVAFRVWAPFAAAVAVTGTFNDWSLTPTSGDGDGYWSVEVKKARPGQEYKFVIDTGSGQVYRNDPRALHLTINSGNSVIVDPSFAWSDEGFVMAPPSQQVIYELHVGTFYRPDLSVGGTFGDVTAKLDYLVDLGVTAVQLMPISSMTDDEGWGYSPDYLYAIESLYGSRQEFMQFVNAAHQRGIGVILDVVYNHIGPGGNGLWKFDGWSQDDKGGVYFYNDWRARTPWGETRLDYGRQEVRQFIVDNVKMWLHDCHVDGLRLDSTVCIRNVNGANNDPGNDIPDGWGLMQSITTLARKLKSSSFIIAEDTGSNEYLTKPCAEGGAGFAAQWEVGFPVVLRRVLDPIADEYRSLGDLLGILEHRYNGDAYQRVIYSDSHDSAANGGSRLNEEISPGDADSPFACRRTLLAASLVCTAPGVPMLFQGQECMEDGSFNDWRALDWERAGRFAGITLAYKHLIALRKNMYGNARGLTGQSFSVLHVNEESKVLAYHRWDQGGPGDDVIVIINFANRVQKDYFINFPRTGVWKVRFNSDWKGYSPDFKDTATPDITVEGDGGVVTIAPYSAIILSQD